MKAEGTRVQGNAIKHNIPGYIYGTVVTFELLLSSAFKDILFHRRNIFILSVTGFGTEKNLTGVRFEIRTQA
jgi:hypothetical protein